MYRSVFVEVKITLFPQILPDNVYSLLALPPMSSALIPCHIHLSEVILKQFNDDKSDLVLTATPPQHFMWTCSKLGLVLDKEEKDTVDKVSEVVPQG